MDENRLKENKMKTLLLHGYTKQAYNLINMILDKKKNVCKPVKWDETLKYNIQLRLK